MSPGAIVHGPSGDGQAPVRGQLEGVLVQGPARLGSQVPRGGAAPAVLPLGPLGPGPGGLAGQHVGDQEPLLIRAEVMIPVPDQGRLVQDRRHAGVGAGLALLRVRAAPPAPGSTGAVNAASPAPAAVTSRLTPPGGAATRRASPPAAGQQPQGPLPARRSLARHSAGWLPGPGTGAGGRAGGQEQQPAVRQERRAVLAFRGPGQPGRSPGGTAGRCRSARCWA